MKKLLANLKLISPLYLLWVCTTLIVGIWSIYNLPFNPSFPYYGDLSAHYNRGVASFAHFDGIHYLRLIRNGYDDTGSQAFFPVYPLLIRTLSFGGMDALIVAIVLNGIFLLSTVCLVTHNMKGRHITRFVVLLLAFPTSFYFLANYTESLFVLLVALFFHFNGRQKYLPAAIVAGVASATRLVGIFLSLALLIELIQNHRRYYSSALLLLISTSGLLGYMYFLFARFGDPLMFMHVQSMFNNGRSGGDIILLPQVIYRYLRIFVTAAPFSPLYLRAVWEFVTFTLSLVVLSIYRFHLNLSTIIFCLCAILLPTLSGTFSSFPRYLLVCLPIFIVLAQNLSTRQFWVIVLLEYGILISAVALFVQGIFIA